MALSEFGLIERFFSPAIRHADLGGGDDCALLSLKPNMQLAISSDMLVEGRHFLSTVTPQRLGHKALAVNLSDLAACGAKPLAFTLALSLTRADEDFLSGFSKGLLALANEFECELIGGDTTQGPLNICITVLGEIPKGNALLRSGAKVGDDIYVSGHIGDARLALEVFRGQYTLSGHDFDLVRQAMELPQPRIALGQKLQELAHSAIDISDGLLGDLQHLLHRSNVGAYIEIDKVPRSAVLASMPQSLQQLCTLSGGDDYELIFTAAPQQRTAIEQCSHMLALPLTRIGIISEQRALVLRDQSGHRVPHQFNSFDHFL